MNTHVAVLERRDITPPPDVNFPSDEEIDQMLKVDADDSVIEAVAKLGYVPPSIKEQRQKRRVEVEVIKQAKKNASLPLAKALRHAGVKPFTPGSIALFKKKAVTPRFQIRKDDLEWYTIIRLIFVGVAINVLLLACVGVFVDRMFGLHANLWLFGAFPVIAMALSAHWTESDHELKSRLADGRSWLSFLAAGSTIWFILCCGTGGKEWRRFSLSGYAKDIPRDVLATIAEVNRHCPKAQFTIEEVGYDPLLCVDLGNEQYYIEVWDEPKFDGKRAA